jgi:hypothetical protein
MGKCDKYRIVLSEHQKKKIVRFFLSWMKEWGGGELYNTYVRTVLYGQLKQALPCTGFLFCGWHILGMKHQNIFINK